MSPGPKADNVAQIAYPRVESDGLVSGWFRFADEYLSPEVRYTSYPAMTSVTVGGRSIQIDRPVAIKIRLLNEDEDRTFWCNKKQHSQRVNLGEYHRDFGDVEVAYSFSSPQTHIWFCGYTIHTDCFENLTIISYNATVRLVPEHVLPMQHLGNEDRHYENEPRTVRNHKADRVVVEEYVPSSRSNFSKIEPHGKTGSADTSNSSGIPPVVTPAAKSVPQDRPILESKTPYCVAPAPVQRFVVDRTGGRRFRSVIDMGLDQNAPFPLYNAYVPHRVTGISGIRVEMFATPEHMNDCDREFILRQSCDVGVPVSQISQPVSCPPVYPPIQPYEHRGLVHSYVGNRRLARQMREGELLRFVKSSVLQMRREEKEFAIRQAEAVANAKYRHLVDKMTDPEFIEKSAFPVTSAECDDMDGICGCRRKTHKFEKSIISAGQTRDYSQSRCPVCGKFLPRESSAPHKRSKSRKKKSSNVSSNYWHARHRTESPSLPTWRYPDRDFHAQWTRECYDPQKAEEAYTNLTTRLRKNFDVQSKGRGSRTKKEFKSPKSKERSKSSTKKSSGPVVPIPVD